MTLLFSSSTAFLQSRRAIFAHCYLSYVKCILRHSLSYDKLHRKNRRPRRKIGTAVLLCKVSQIFFHVLIRNTVYHLAFLAIEDELSGDRAVAVLGLGAFLLVDQMAILLRDSFLAVLDLKNPTGACLRVKHHHVKFAHGELQDKYLLLGVCQLGFQQDDILQHPSFDLGQDALLHSGALCQRQRAERFIQQQAPDQRIRLRIAETRLYDHRVADLMEELRAVYADRFVLSCVNRKIITAKHLQKQESGAVLLTDDGRRAFLGAWQSKKQEQITHPFLKEKIPWGLVPYVQALLLARTLRGDLEAYPPFFWK